MMVMWRNEYMGRYLLKSHKQWPVIGTGSLGVLLRMCSHTQSMFCSVKLHNAYNFVSSLLISTSMNVLWASLEVQVSSWNGPKK